jgi:thiamine-phosphate pyrophosphorylase
MLPISRSLFSQHFYASQKRHPFDLSLYLVANRPSFNDENLFFSKILKGVQGGVSCVQLRDHKNDFASIIQTAKRLRKMLKNVPLFINTLQPIETAQIVEAEGVFLEESFSYSEVRKMLGEKAIIGLSVKTMQQVIELGNVNDIDYLSVKIFPSKQTCPRNDQIWNLAKLREIRAVSPHRIVAIGGLTLEQTEDVYKELHWNDGIAMAGGLMRENDPYMTSQKIQEIRQRMKEMS